MADIEQMREKAQEMLPDHMIGGMSRYIEFGIPPGDFLRAILTNDLKEAFARADDTNVQYIDNYIKFLFNFVPSTAWGSPEAYHYWCSRGGWHGESHG